MCCGINSDVLGMLAVLVIWPSPQSQEADKDLEDQQLRKDHVPDELTNEVSSLLLYLAAILKQK